MDDVGGMGGGFGRAVILLALIAWGMWKCHKLTASEHVNISAVRGLFYALAGLAALLLVVAMRPPAPANVWALAAAGAISLAGVVLSVQGLARWAARPLGNKHGIAGLVIGAAIAVLIVRSLAHEVTSDDMLAMMAAEASRDLPRALDADNELTEVGSEPGTLIYYLRLTKLTAAQVNRAGFLATAKSDLISRTCADAEADKVWKHARRIRASYAGRDGLPIGSVEVERADCGRPGSSPTGKLDAQ